MLVLLAVVGAIGWRNAYPMFLATRGQTIALVDQGHLEEAADLALNTPSEPPAIGNLFFGRQVFEAGARVAARMVDLRAILLWTVASALHLASRRPRSLEHRRPARAG